MFRLIVAIIIVYFIYRIGKALILPAGKVRQKFPGRRSEIGSEDLVKDPCCGTYVPINSAFKINLKGETLYFCSEECREKYQAEIGKEN